MKETRSALAKSSLSEPQAQFIDLMQRLNFGSIEGLVIRDGQPVFDPPPRVVRDVKFGGKNGPRPEAAMDDFVLKKQIRDLFCHFDTLGDGTILRLEVKHGLPFRMQVEENA